MVQRSKPHTNDAKTATVINDSFGNAEGSTSRAAPTFANPTYDTPDVKIGVDYAGGASEGMYSEAPSDLSFVSGSAQGNEATYGDVDLYKAPDNEA